MNKASKQIQEMLKQHGVTELLVTYQRNRYEHTGICFQIDGVVIIKSGDELIHARTGLSMYHRGINFRDVDDQFKDRAADWTRRVEGKNLKKRLIRIDSFTRIQCSCGAKVDYVIHGQDNSEEFACASCLVNDFVSCAGCGTNTRRTKTFEHSGLMYCKTCHDSGFFTCDHCHKDCMVDNKHTIDDNGTQRNLCDICFQLLYVECDECGTRVSRDACVAVSGLEYCASCASQKLNNANPYSFKPAPKFMLSPRETSRRIKVVRFFGFELEIGCAPKEAKGVAEVNKACGDWTYCKDDASIAEHGFEMVSHPCSLELLMDRKEVLGVLFRKLSQMGYRGHDVVDAGHGLHVHVSKAAMERLGWMKLDFLLNNHPVLFKKLARRETRFGKTMAKKMTECGKNAHSLLDNGTQATNADRYVSLNFLNPKTVEFRLWRSTLNVETFIATLQLCDLLVDFANRRSLADIMNYKLMEEQLAVEMMAGPEELKAYANQRGMFQTVLEAESQQPLIQGRRIRHNIVPVTLGQQTMTLS